MANSKQSPRAGGVYAALATPQRPDSTEADAAALLDYLDTVVRTGVDGLVLFGSTGEFVHFDVAERMRVVTLAIRRSRVPVLVNVSHSTLAGAIDLAEQAIEAGAAGVLGMPPYFYRYTDVQLLEFYRQLVRTVGGKTRIYLYNLPQFTNPLSAGLATHLLESGDFAGIKDSSGDWQFYHTLRQVRERAPFILMCGNEAIYLDCRAGGADGIVSGVAAAIPELMVAMDRAIRANKQEMARQLNGRLQEFVHWADKFPATIAIKQAAVSRGWKLNRFPFRFDDDTQADLAAFHHWLSDWIPAVLAECGSTTAVTA